MPRPPALFFTLVVGTCTAAITLTPSIGGYVLAAEQNPASSATKTSAKKTTKIKPKSCAQTNIQRGKASWYGTEANKGKKTASGETFDPNAPTAAHPTLPMGTEIDVKNLENGKETTLTVNDRGPKTKGRVLDVSKKGAEQLGIGDDGTAKVQIEPKTGPAAQPKKANGC